MPLSPFHAIPKIYLPCETCFDLTFLLLKKSGSKSRPQVQTHLQFLMLVQLHSRKGAIVFIPDSPNFPPPPPFFGWHGRHCVWWLRGLILLGSWFASFASEVAWQLHRDIFLLFVEGKQKLGCFSCSISHDVTYNERTQRQATFQLIQSQNPSSLIQSVFGPHHAVSGSYPAIQHGRGACLATRDLDRKLD